MRRAGELPHVLLVEENEDHAELIRLALEGISIPMELRTVTDGQEALDSLFKSEAATPRLILLDLRLPKLDGQEVLARIRKSSRFDSLPVVILSTSNSEIDILESYRNGASSYLVKPFGFQEMQATLHAAVEYWLRVRRP